MVFNLKYIAVRKPPKRMKSHIVASILYIGIAQFKKLGSIRHGSILLAAHLSNISGSMSPDEKTRPKSMLNNMLRPTMTRIG